MDLPVCMITYNNSKTDEQYCTYAINSQLLHVIKLPHMHGCSKQDYNNISVTSILASTANSKTITLEDLLGGKF